MKMSTGTYELQFGCDTFDVGVVNPVSAEKSEGGKVSIGEALMISLKKNVSVDVHYMSEVTGLSKNCIIENLRGAIYQNPETWNGDIYEEWELLSQYVSGNLFEKHKIA